MATTNPIVSSLPAYVDQHKLGLVEKTVMEGRTIDNVNVQTGIRGTTAINILTTDVKFSDGSVCGFTPDGTQTFTQRDIVTGAVKVNVEYCAKVFRNKYPDYMLRYGAGKETLPYEEYLVNSIVKSTQRELDRVIWFGDTEKSGNIQFFDGYLKIAGADGAIAVDKVAGTGAYETIHDAYMALPAEVFPNAIAFCSPSILRKYSDELLEKNLFHFAPESNPNEIMIPNTNIRLIATPGLAPLGSEDEYIVMGDKNNFYYGCDLQGDEEQFTMDYDKTSDTFKLAIGFNAGVQFAFPDQIVLAKIAHA